MATIGSIVINTKMGVAQLQKDIKSASGILGGFGNSVVKSFGGMKAAIGAGLAAVGAGVAVSTLSGWVNEAVEASDAAWKLSGSLGIAQDRLMGLQQVAKLDGDMEIEQFNTSLKNMLKTLSEGGADGTLAEIGLDAAKLKAMKPDEAFIQIADAINKIGDPGKQLAALSDIFGKAGKDMLPLINQGAAGLEAGIANAKKMGTALDDIDAAKLVAAKQQFEEIGARFEGLKNMLAIAVIPYVTAFIDEILAIAPAASDMKDFFVQGLRVIASAIGVVADGWQWLKIGVIGLTAMALKNIQMQVDAVYKLGEAVLWVYNKLTKSNAQMPQFLQNGKRMVDDLANGMTEVLKEEFNKEMPSAGIDAFFTNIENKANNTAAKMLSDKKKFSAPIVDGFIEAKQKITAILTDLQNQLDTFGMDEFSKKIAELKKANAKPEDIAKAEAIIKQLKDLQEKKALIDAGKSLAESLRTPFEIFKDSIASYDKMLKAGAIDPEIYARAVEKAQKELDDATKPANAEAEKVDWTKRASVVSRMFDFTGPTDKKNDAVAIAKETKDINKQQVNILKNIEKNTTKAWEIVNLSMN